MANFVSQLSSDEANRLSAHDMETLYAIQAKVNGEIPSDEERQKKFKEYIQKRSKELLEDDGYAESLEKEFC
jgi:hypothetical protein